MSEPWETPAFRFPKVLLRRCASGGAVEPLATLLPPRLVRLPPPRLVRLLATSRGHAQLPPCSGASVGTGMGRARPGSHARGLGMRLCGTDGLSSARLLQACSKPTGRGPGLGLGSPLRTLTLEAFICLARGIKMLLVLD